MEPGGTVLVVDDDEVLLRALSRDTSHRIVTAKTIAEARSLLATTRPCLAVVDLRIGSDSGLALVKEIKLSHPSVDVVLTSAYLSTAVTVAAMKAGADDVVPKPITLREIVQRLAHTAEPDLSRTRQRKHRARGDDPRNRTEHAEALDPRVRADRCRVMVKI